MYVSNMCMEYKHVHGYVHVQVCMKDGMYRYSRVALQRTLRGVGKKYVVMVVRCIRTENFSLRGIGTWGKKYVITVDTL